LIKAYISRELIDELEEKYPHRCPEINVTERELWVYVGMRELVDILKFSYQEQQKKASEKVLT
jgi:hypothetical protein